MGEVTAATMAALDAAHEAAGLTEAWVGSEQRARFRVVDNPAPWVPFELPRPAAFVHLPVPDTDYFVRLRPSVDDVVPEQAEPAKLVVEKNSYAMTISREMALDHGIVEPTLDELVDRAVASTRHRVEEVRRRAAPGPAVTVESLLEHLGWSAAYAAHLLHPACWCSPRGDDPAVCSWGRELGFSYDFESETVVGP